ncbi:methionine/alanine import family NSS transporter small subunit [Halodesulfovibrio aestuarii]|uniref:Methionine/alanine import family NSS transporter small subunit n=1 Tax=Halodesulfovibrio aestuarii TaxID=126333 RepID=A0ABV4JN43_9BACT|nr:methionine/alanine import family NSS transporter small subunit [Halodesulfovibrio aestuarii]
MATSAIIMMVLGLLVTWGGAAFCISVAIRNRDI